MQTIQYLIDNPETVAVVIVAVLGALVSALRVIAPLTAWTGDNWALSKLEALLAWFVVPGRLRADAARARLAAVEARIVADHVIPPGGDRPA